VQGTARSALHGQQLRTVLGLAALYDRRGLGIATVSHAALALGCSEHRAGALLTEGQGLAELPGALEAVECGLLWVEHPPWWCGSCPSWPLAGPRARARRHLSSRSW
jgi:hypothetical protein